MPKSSVGSSKCPFRAKKSGTSPEKGGGATTISDSTLLEKDPTKRREGRSDAASVGEDTRRVASLRAAPPKIVEARKRCSPRRVTGRMSAPSPAPIDLPAAMVAPAMKPIAASSTDVPACRETTGRSPRSPRLLRAGALTAGLAALALGAGCTRLPMQAPPPRRPSPLVTPPSPPAPKAGGAVFAATAIDDLENQDGVHFFARRKEGALLVFSKGGRFFARAARPRSKRGRG